jgi:hypothetical protein
VQAVFASTAGIGVREGNERKKSRNRREKAQKAQKIHEKIRGIKPEVSRFSAEGSG